MGWHACFRAAALRQSPWEPEIQTIWNLTIHSFCSILKQVSQVGISLECLQRHGLDTVVLHPLLSVPLIFLTVAAASLAVSAVLGRVPWLKDHVV